MEGNGNTICSLSFTVDSITGNGNRISDTGSKGPGGANFVFVTGNGNTVNVPGFGDTVRVGATGAPALGDSVTDEADNTMVTVSGDADDVVIPMLDSGDTITCTGNGITSLSSSDCVLTP